MPDKTSDQWIVLFDGPCGMCQKSVRFLARRDHAQTLRVASLQSKAGMDLRQRYGLPTDDGSIQSVVLIEGDQAFTHSTAALRAMRHVGLPWSALGTLGLLIPRPLRDAAYRTIAHHRHRIFSAAADSCSLDEAVQKRVINEI